MALQNFGIKPIKDFLSDTYLIPDYQREYSWGKEELEDLWDDLIYIENNINDKHFFGQVVVNNTEKEKYIIDGQQRATTSTILICVIMREFENIYNNSEHQFPKAYKKAQQIQIKLVGTEDEDDEQERFHITLGEIDNLYFKSVFGNFSFYSYKKACGQKKTVRGSKNSRRLSNGTPAI